MLLSYLFSRLPFKMKCSDNTNFTMGLKTKHFEVATIFWSLRYVVFCLLKTQVFPDLWNWRNWLLHDTPDICIFILDVFVLSETLFAIKLKSVAVTKHAKWFQFFSPQTNLIQNFSPRKFSTKVNINSIMIVSSIISKVSIHERRFRHDSCLSVCDYYREENPLI